MEARAGKNCYEEGSVREGVSYQSPEGSALIERELAILNQAVVALPNDPDIRRARATVFGRQAFMTGRKSARDNMLTEILKVVELVPDYNEAYQRAGELCSLNGDQTKSQYYYDLASEKRRLRGVE